MPSIPIEQPAAAKPAVPDNLRLWDAAATCALFGNIDVSTLYRGMSAGRYPRPILVSAHVARWLASECEATLAAMIAERDKPRKRPERRRKGRRIESAETEAAAAVKLADKLEAASKAKVEA